LNCPMAVTVASVFYVFRCLMPAYTPQTAAIFHCISIRAEKGSLVNAQGDAAVAAGNVETSQRIVDVVSGALDRAIPGRMPAAAQGTMNNIIFGGDAGGRSGDDAWVYYETLAGGMGGHAAGDGLSAVQCHMTNTKNSSIEVLEMHYPLRVRHYAVRRGSGGAGRQRGGDGLIREWEVLEDCHWLDALSRDLLAAIGRTITDLPVLLVMAYRPPDLQEQPMARLSDLPHFTEIVLDEFTPEEAERLIRLKLEQFFGAQTEMPPALIERITARAGGNPFYIEELLNYLQDRGIDPQNTAALETFDLPDSLHSLILHNTRKIKTISSF